VIIVAQRISTIKDADQILVMNQGRIEAVGTHEELMQSSRTYQEIVASQPTDKEVAS
jgi:ATP-binding cassette subfamily B multidrug efflux pump